MAVVVTVQTLLLGGSPQVGINSSQSCDADKVEVKDQGDAYNVWDDDWTE